jgi:hypothetical protein
LEEYYYTKMDGRVGIEKLRSDESGMLGQTCVEAIVWCRRILV